jgi:hypothetical protein
MTTPFRVYKHPKEQRELIKLKNAIKVCIKNGIEIEFSKNVTISFENKKYSVMKWNVYSDGFRDDGVSTSFDNFDKAFETFMNIENETKQKD